MTKEKFAKTNFPQKLQTSHKENFEDSSEKEENQNYSKFSKEKKFYGTMKEFLKQKYNGPFSATDILIRYNDGKKDGLVLIERKFSPLGLAIPGGIAEKMAYLKNAIKEAKEETGLDIIIDEPSYRPFTVFSDVGDDSRAHISSICYTAQGFGTLKPMADEDAKWAKVFTLEEISGMLKEKNIWAFNRHRKILSIYLVENKFLEEFYKN